MTTTIATTAVEIAPADIVVLPTLTGAARRAKVTTVTTLDVVIVDPAKGTRTVYPTVRLGLGHGGESLDFAPGDAVTIVR